MTGLLVAGIAAAGVYLLVTRFIFGWRAFRRPRPERTARHRTDPRDWLAQAGLVDVRWSEVALVCTVLAVAGFLLVFAVFGGVVPALIVAGATGSGPLFASRASRRRRIALAQEAWPRIIEEVRVLTGSTGVSIPQALFRVGRRTPPELRDAFDAAQREWQLTIDFSRAIAVLKTGLADPTADAACETLLTAHEIGGIDLERRLVDLAEDRMTDVQGRKDARAKQAGARFARLFVLVAPAGMALVGLGIGEGRAAYRTATGQVLVVAGILVTLGCWLWASRVMALPAERRVFSE